jgi:hypothetical protein
MAKSQHVISEAKLDTPPGYIADPQWYDEYETLKIEPPKLVIDLARLMGDRFTVHSDVYLFLTEHGLDDQHALAMANKLLRTIDLDLLHPATLGVVVQPAGAGHWQIVAERGQ